MKFNNFLIASSFSVAVTAAPYSALLFDRQTSLKGAHHDDDTGDIGFDCASTDFTLNSVPASSPFPKYLGLPDDDRCYLRLTEAVPLSGLGSSAFKPFAFPSATNYNFSVQFSYRLFGGFGDGMTFVLHQDAHGVNALGQAGGNMGVHAPSSGSITPALVVELDTFANNVATSQAYLKDTTGNSIHVLTNVGGVLSEFAETVVDFATPSDGTFGTVWIDYCNDTLEVFVDKDGETKPGTPQVTATVNLQGLFTGTDFFVGFTAGVQDQAQNHDIFSFEMQSKGSTC